MNGNYIFNPYNNELNGLLFQKRVGKYSFYSSIFMLEDDEKRGRFDFDYNKSSQLTGKGKFSIVIKNAIECIDFLFNSGCKYIVIQAAPDKQEKRLSTYRKVLEKRYFVCGTYDPNKILISKWHNF